MHNGFAGEYPLRDIQPPAMARRKIMQETLLLTSREKEILDLSMKGIGCKQIALHLGISTSTVKKHRSSLMDKPGASSMVELVGRMTGEKK